MDWADEKKILTEQNCPKEAHQADPLKYLDILLTVSQQLDRTFYSMMYWKIPRADLL